MNQYDQINITLVGYGDLKVSYFTFQEGSLVGSFDEKIISKPDRYDTWRTRRRETFLAGRLAVRHAQKALKLPLVDIPKASDGSPHWPKNYLGSISHTDNKAVAVLVLDSHPSMNGIGIDVEEIGKANLLESDEMIGMAQEFQLLSQINRGTEFLRLLLFSLKESIYKALHPMVGEYFDFLDVALIEIKEGVLTFQVLRDLSKSVKKGFVIKGDYQVENGLLLTWAYW